MPRLIVPSSGGGTKLMRTFLAGEAEGVCSGASGDVTDASGEGENDGDSCGVGVGVGSSWATAITPMATHTATIGNPPALTRLRRAGLAALCDSNIIAPVHVWKEIIAPFTIAQKFLVNIV